MNRFIMILTVGLVLLLFAGCEESQQNGSKVWGNGDLPLDYAQMFGTDNTSRLNFVQNKLINQHDAVIAGIDITGEDGKTQHKRGLIERITTLEAKVEALEGVKDE